MMKMEATKIRLTTVDKRGVEQPQVIIYTLFVVILTLSGIYVAFTFLGGVDITIDFHDYASRLNTASSRIIFSPQCFALETNYIKEGVTSYQVSSGIMDAEKFSGTLLMPSSCVTGESMWAKLQSIESGYEFDHEVWTCGELPVNIIEGLINVGKDLIAKGTVSQADINKALAICTRPTQEQLATEWRQGARSFYVLIEDNNAMHKGVLTVRLKE
jgi:hypothetical protein